jgi:hypothetical protein
VVAASNIRLGCWLRLCVIWFSRLCIGSFGIANLGSDIDSGLVWCQVVAMSMAATNTHNATCSANTSILQYVHLHKHARSHRSPYLDCSPGSFRLHCESHRSAVGERYHCPTCVEPFPTHPYGTTVRSIDRWQQWRRSSECVSMIITQQNTRTTQCIYSTTHLVSLNPMLQCHKSLEDIGIYLPASIRYGSVIQYAATVGIWCTHRLDSTTTAQSLTRTCLIALLVSKGTGIRDSDTS